MLKAFLCSSSFFLLHSLSISQNLHLKGQLLASSISSNDVPDNWQAYESIFSYIPTLSFSKKIEKIVVKIGAAKDILTTVAKGRLLRAIKIATSAINPDRHLKK